MEPERLNIDGGKISMGRGEKNQKGASYDGGSTESE